MLTGLLFFLTACDPWRYDHVLQRVTCVVDGQATTFDAPGQGMRPVLIYDHQARALDVELVAADGFE